MSMESIIRFDAFHEQGEPLVECELNIYNGQLVAIMIDGENYDLEIAKQHGEVTEQLCKVLEPVIVLPGRLASEPEQVDDRVMHHE